MRVFLAMLLTAQSTLASITPSCEGAQRAIRSGQEAAWLRQCITVQQSSGVTGDAEATCRALLERCRSAPTKRPGIMTY